MKASKRLQKKKKNHENEKIKIKKKTNQNQEKIENAYFAKVSTLLRPEDGMEIPIMNKIKKRGCQLTASFFN